MSDLRKIHLTLRPETLNFVRNVAFECNLSVSELIDYVLEDWINQPDETAEASALGSPVTG